MRVHQGRFTGSHSVKITWRDRGHGGLIGARPDGWPCADGVRVVRDAADAVLTRVDAIGVADRTAADVSVRGDAAVTGV